MQRRLGHQHKLPAASEPFIRKVEILSDRVGVADEYPFSIPAVRHLNGLELGRVTYFVGENGSGKSTLLEAIAVAAGFNAEGGTANFSFATHRSESDLHERVRLTRSVHRPRTGFFLRAETFYNVATEIERLGVGSSYGNKSLHEMSHGEAFLALMKHRFGPCGLYVLDEPEAALSPARQLALLHRLHELTMAGSQFLIATHAPIVLAYPGATIYRLDNDGINPTTFDETEQVTLTRDFLNHRPRFLDELFSGDD